LRYHPHRPPSRRSPHTHIGRAHQEHPSPRRHPHIQDQEHKPGITHCGTHTRPKAHHKRYPHSITTPSRICCALPLNCCALPLKEDLFCLGTQYRTATTRTPKSSNSSLQAPVAADAAAAARAKSSAKTAQQPQEDGNLQPTSNCGTLRQGQKSTNHVFQHDTVKCVGHTGGKSGFEPTSITPAVPRLGSAPLGEKSTTNLAILMLTLAHGG
jgi:hypothetical protein